MVWHTGARVGGKDRVHRRKKRQEKEMMYEGSRMPEFCIHTGRFLCSFGK
jgi:hypothetical protein